MDISGILGALGALAGFGGFIWAAVASSRRAALEIALAKERGTRMAAEFAVKLARAELAATEARARAAKALADARIRTLEGYLAKHPEIAPDRLRDLGRPSVLPDQGGDDPRPAAPVSGKPTP